MNLKNLKKKHGLTDSETKQAQETIAKALTNLCAMSVVLAFLELVTAGDIEGTGDSDKEKAPDALAGNHGARENISTSE